MKQSTYQFSSSACTIYTDTDFSQLAQLVPGNLVLVTDEHVFAAHQPLLAAHPCIVLPAGEANKIQATADHIITRLIELKADRSTTLAGVGGGVITDITGYAASIYMRGIPFGFVPTTILAMADAAIGGKNGVDVGLYKNLVGTIRQPQFLLYDMSLLHSLPEEQWINGFAEVIKHACIKDAALFDLLEQHHLEDFRTTPALLLDLIERNIAIKCNVVVQDEWEKGDRKLLNFGHTIGHAIENTHQLLHGHAVSIGMVAACRISEEINNFYSADKERVIKLLQQYHLPIALQFDQQQVADAVLLDKKRVKDMIHFILLDHIGHAVIRPVPTGQFRSLLSQIF